jgi:dTDP-4-dehydrorhamnose 3,5-epimerase
MKFAKTELKGAFIIELDPRRDHRGFFARAWCQREMIEHGLNPRIAQINTGFSPKRGTLRGMHYQKAPHEEAKVVRCTKGAVYDVIVDLRPRSPTHKKWVGVELSAQNLRMVYVPEGFAHGYETLEDESEIYYLTSEFYNEEASMGVRYNDSVFGIEWPLSVEVISDADRTWPDYIR